MAKLVKETCSRCGGSGHYSFHMVKGTVCFGCNGTGHVMADPAKKAAKIKAAGKKAASQQCRREMMIKAYNEVVEEMNALYGPFDVSTALGIDRLNLATAKATGKALHVIRDERIKSTEN